MASVTCICFDLDGTLTDPFEGITRCHQHALRAMGAQVPAQEDLAAWIGPPLRETFATLLETENTATIEQAVAHYRERFARIGMLENRVYDGVHDMLATLAGEGFRLIVVTSKVRTFASTIIEHFELAASVSAVYGSELDGRHDDKRELLRHALDSEDVEASQAIMVGDRRMDIAAARAVGAHSIGVTYGFGSRDELRDADLVVDSPGAIIDAVRSVAAGFTGSP